MLQWSIPVVAVVVNVVLVLVLVVVVIVMNRYFTFHDELVDEGKIVELCSIRKGRLLLENSLM